MAVKNKKNIKVFLLFFALAILCSSFVLKSKKDILTKVKVIHVGSLFGMRVTSFRCEDFFDSSGFYIQIITDRNLLQRLEKYRRSATSNIAGVYKGSLPPNNAADGKMYYYYKSGIIDSMCFYGDYLYCNGMPMAVPKGRFMELYNLLDSLSDPSHYIIE